MIKSCEKGGFLHISDLTHVFAAALQRLYKPDEDFTGLCSTCSSLRQKWSMSKEKCAFMPPSQRGKVRFANIFPVIKWAHDVLQIRATLPPEIWEQTAFLVSNAAMISELYAMNAAIKTMSKLLKIQGFSAENAVKAKEILGTIPETVNTKRFVAEINGWIDETESTRQKINLPTVFCCSDIIESTFGKFKSKVNVQSPFGITEFALTIANFGIDFSDAEIRQALETVKLKKLKEWGPKIKSMARKKWDIFPKKQREKKNTKNESS